jgi:hypothetical protein
VAELDGSLAEEGARVVEWLELEVTEPAVSMEIVEEIRECSLQVDALAPELQCLEPAAEVVVVKEVVCNSASEIATDEVEVSVPR